MDHKGATGFILNLLKANIPKDLYYHGVHHTMDVCEVVEELAIAEGVSEESVILLKTAAAFHDCGFVKQYFDNEPVAVTCVETHLPAFGYSQEQIKIIAGIILATQVPQRPTNHLEEIMCDADLDYLGREDFFQISETLKAEWLAYKIVSSENDFNIKQLNFFKEHKYFTRTADLRRSGQKQKHLIQLQKRCGVYSVK